MVLTLCVCCRCRLRSRRVLEHRDTRKRKVAGRVAQAKESIRGAEQAVVSKELLM